MTCDNGEDHQVVGVQYGRGGDTPYHYDGVSEYACRTCGRRVGRWCGNRLEENQVEPPFCDGQGEHPIVLRGDES